MERRRVLSVVSCLSDRLARMDINDFIGRKARSEEREDNDEEEAKTKKVKTEELEGDGEADAPAVENESY